MKTNLLLTAMLSLSFCSASTAQTLPAYLPTDGLVGWWPFNGNANDESGNGNDGVVNGATLTVDRFGAPNSAYNFNANEYISGSCGSFPSGNQARTISCWYLGNQLGAEGNCGQQLLGYGGNSCGQSYNINFDNADIGNDYIGKYEVQGHCLFFRNYTSYPTPANGSWQFVSITYDGAILRFFNNGNLVFTSNSVMPETYVSSRIFCFGKVASESGLMPYTNPCWPGFNGKIDDIAIYNRALSPEEITALYTGEPVNPPTACNPLPSNLQNGLVGYWPFCGNANDESGNGNDGTVNGATLTQDRFGVANAAYDFDGVDDYIDCGNNSELNLTNFTLAVWYKLNNLPLSVTDENVLVVKSDYNPGTLGYRIAISTEPQNADYFIWSQMGGGNSCGDYTNTNDAPSILEWTHIVAIKDEGTIKIFKNGIEENSKSGLCGNFNNERPLLFGCKYDYILVDILNGFFDGSLDDIGIWNRALTPDEVQQLYTLNACTFTIYDTVTVTETIYDTVSVSVSTTDTLIINTLITTIEPAQENTFLVYPNPASTQITINNGNVAILGGYTMRISNSLGQDVYNQTITQPEVTLDLSTWGGNGLYVLYIVDPQQNIVAVKQIVLQ